MSGMVEYDIKELLDKLSSAIEKQMTEVKASLDAIAMKLDDKASNVRVEAIEKRLVAVEERLSHLELSTAGSAAVSVYQRWIFGTIGVGVLGAISTLVWLAAGGH